MILVEIALRETESRWVKNSILKGKPACGARPPSDQAFRPPIKTAATNIVASSAMASASRPALWIDPGQRTVHHAELGKVKTTPFDSFTLPRTNR